MERIMQGLRLNGGRVSARALILAAASGLLFVSAPASIASAHTHQAATVAAKAEPTTLSTSLSGGAQAAGTITVPEGTAVTDNATLSGPNSATAGGTVSYKIYSDSACTDEVASRGTFKVIGGSLPASKPKTLPAGTYYWQASYGGDEGDEPSMSACGAAVETVEPVPPRTCTSASGEARVLVEGERQVAKYHLSTDLAGRERFTFRWEDNKQRVRLIKLTSAFCLVKVHKSVFHGVGSAKLNGVGGYTVTLNITISNHGTLTVGIRLRKNLELLDHVIDRENPGQGSIT
jgi:hypothetical protein